MDTPYYTSLGYAYESSGEFIIICVPINGD